MRNFKAEIICTGSELLSGKLNLYVPLFYEKLFPLGFEITREQSSGDSLRGIADCIQGALKATDLVLVCGGLGPTFDDLTRQAAAAALKKKIVYSKTLAAGLKKKYGLKKLPPNLRDQCLKLDGAKAIENRNGTAAGQEIRLKNKMVVLLPGPLKEWEPMFEDALNADLKTFFSLKNAAPKRIKLKISGMGEAAAANLLRPVMERFKEARYTILAGPWTAEFIITANSRITEIEKACRGIMDDKIYGINDDTLEGAAGALLTKAGLTLSCAESCTGGLLSSLITDISGSSAYFKGSALTYSNTAKTRLLKVRPETLKKHGAVSEPCAREMALGAKKLFSSDYAVAVTGTAGPAGGTQQKPVGTVCFALAGPEKTTTFTKHFLGARTFIKRCAANFALDELRKIIE
ncbi:MAG: nicotinamide-nucleotide amidohydrolase family protein [Elusimicrobia bacterium]|nr:nicotinamide-nucleotide amidohydrolase family protein [Elusimicrobiota bacterium]